MYGMADRKAPDWKRILGHDWPYLRTLLPDDLDGILRACGGVQRRRELKDADVLLRLALAYAHAGLSGAEVAEWARRAGVCAMSGEAVLKRLRKSADFLGGVLAAQLARWVTPPAWRVPTAGLRIENVVRVTHPTERYDWHLSLRCVFREGRLATVAVVGDTSTAHSGMGWSDPIQRGEAVAGELPLARIRDIRLAGGHAIAQLEDQRPPFLYFYPTEPFVRDEAGFPLTVGDSGEVVRGRLVMVNALRMRDRQEPSGKVGRGSRRQPSIETPAEQRVIAPKWVTLFTTVSDAELSTLQLFDCWRFTWQIRRLYRYEVAPLVGVVAAGDLGLRRAYLLGKLLGGLLYHEFAHHLGPCGPWGYGLPWTAEGLVVSTCADAPSLTPDAVPGEEGTIVLSAPAKLSKRRLSAEIIEISRAEEPQITKKISSRQATREVNEREKAFLAEIARLRWGGPTRTTTHLGCTCRHCARPLDRTKLTLRGKLRCPFCAHETSLFVGTAFEDAKLPPDAIRRMLQFATSDRTSPLTVSAVQIHIEIKSNNTARRWYGLLLAAMRYCEPPLGDPRETYRVPAEIIEERSRVQLFLFADATSPVAGMPVGGGILCAVYEPAGHGARVQATAVTSLDDAVLTDALGRILDHTLFVGKRSVAIEGNIKTAVVEKHQADIVKSLKTATDSATITDQGTVMASYQYVWGPFNTRLLEKQVRGHCEVILQHLKRRGMAGRLLADHLAEAVFFANTRNQTDDERYRLLLRALIDPHFPANATRKPRLRRPSGLAGAIITRIEEARARGQELTRAQLRLEFLTTRGATQFANAHTAAQAYLDTARRRDTQQPGEAGPQQNP